MAAAHAFSFRPMKRTLVPLAATLALSAAVLAVSLGSRPGASPVTHDIPAAVQQAKNWRAAHRTIDLHQHIEGNAEAFARAIRIMDRAGVGIGVNLSGGTVTAPDGEKSEFEKVKTLADANHPGRFVHYMNLDYAGWDAPDFADKAAAQIEKGHRLGAAGLKEYKRLGLFLRDGQKNLMKIDDPRLDAVWRKCGELKMPVSIHVADPRAFWLPFDDKNERWKELKDHKSWWFGDAARYPSREDLLASLDRVIARHRDTTFVCVHFANNAEDLEWVDAALTRNPNMLADVAARIPEAGRHDPEKVRALFRKYPGRFLFATDFMVYNKLILGSGGDDEKPTEDDAVVFYEKCWKWFETAETHWPHMTPIQGDWPISSISLEPALLRRVYFDNAAQLLARSLPPPVLTAARTQDFDITGKADHPAWAAAAPVSIDQDSVTAAALPHIATTLRALWSDHYLYLSYECPYKELTTFEPPQHQTDRMGLWDRDVVEIFLAPDPARPAHYAEIEWAPTGEKLDLMVNLPDRDFGWDYAGTHKVTVDPAAKIWRVETRIPWERIGRTPSPGTEWRANFFRHDAATRSGLAFRPALTGTFHTPARFGLIRFAPPAP